MTQVDDRILEYLQEEGMATPSCMARTFRFTASEGRIRARCWTLVEREMVAPFHRDLFEITRWGQAYLRGDLDAQYLPKYTIG
jgi:hypothetical protein